VRGGDRGLTVVVVVTHHDLLDLAVLAHLAPEILVEGVEVVLQLARVHLVLGVVGWVLVEVGEQDRLRVRGLDVFSGAAVAVAAGAYFVVEGTVDLRGKVSLWGSSRCCYGGFLRTLSCSVPKMEAR